MPRHAPADERGRPPNLPAAFAVLALLALLSLLAVVPAAAAAGDCEGYASLKDGPTVTGGRIAAGAGKTHFVKGAVESAGCPASGAACARKSFLLPGDEVLVSGRDGAFACATYSNGKGEETTGWLPAAALAMTPPAGGTTVEDWAGSWLRDEATVVIRPAPGDRLAIKGDATFGAHDPDRVKRGGVNIGEISGTPAPAGDRLSFAIGDEGRTLPVDKGDEYACRVWMRRIGPYLLVDDNNGCGGMNVSFRGTYVRR